MNEHTNHKTTPTTDDFTAFDADCTYPEMTEDASGFSVIYVNKQHIDAAETDQIEDDQAQGLQSDALIAAMPRPTIGRSAERFKDPDQQYINFAQFE